MTSPAEPALETADGLPDRRLLRQELALVLWLSIAASALNSALSLVNSLTRNVPLRQQVAELVSSYTPDRPWLDLAYQFAHVGLALVPVLLVGYLLVRSGESWASLGLDTTRVGRDVLTGVGLAAAIGIPGLAVYLLAYHLGLSIRIDAAAVAMTWYTIPMLLVYAAYNAILEETIVLGYTLHRADQLGVRPRNAIVGSALLRGAYHLYQGLSGFAGNFAMGLLFGVLYRRWRRLLPFLVAHFTIDSFAFVGYLLLHGHVSWLP